MRFVKAAAALTVLSLVLAAGAAAQHTEDVAR